MSGPLIPPNDLDAEGACIAAVFFDPATFDEIALVLKPEHFYADANRRIWEAMAGLAAAGRPPDVTAVMGWLRDHNRLEQVGGSTYLAQFAQAPAVARPLEHAERVVGKARLRALINACRKLVADAYGPVEDVTEFVRKAEAQVYAVAEIGARASRSATAREIVRECVVELEEKYHRRAERGLSTGFVSLDRRIGWLREGRVYTVAARPGMGKTSFASHVAKTVMLSKNKKKRGVFFASLEMDRTQIIGRAIAQEAQLDTRAFDTGVLSRTQYIEACARASDVAAWPLVVDDTPALTVADMRALIRRAARRLENEYGTELALVVIDYAQLIGRVEARGKTTNDQLAAVSAGVLALAKEFQVPVVLLAQLNRDCEKRPDKRPQLSDLRDSGALEQDAHSVIFLYRDDVYKKPDEPKDGVVELIVAKARGGRTGTVRVHFVARWTLFVDAEDDDPDDEFAQQIAELGDEFDVENAAPVWEDSYAEP